MVARTRWRAEFGPAQRREYATRFLEPGYDTHGEARFLDALLPPGCSVLDGGCGTARVGAELARRGHRVTAVDDDELLVAAAPVVAGLAVVRADLAELELGVCFDAAVLAGNVMVYLAPGSEPRVLARLRRHLPLHAPLVAGFATDRTYTLDQFDVDAARGGFEGESRFSTWDLRPWRAGAEWAVSVLRAR